jgi:serine/threonine protein phosphatase PrpC
VLTRDHGADSKLEKARIAELHGDADTVITRSSDGECRVKGITAVTRGLGLQHLKTLMPCLAYNKQVPPDKRISPRPGAPSKIIKGTQVPPYVLNEAEVSDWEVTEDGFLILASDGEFR